VFFCQLIIGIIIDDLAINRMFIGMVIGFMFIFNDCIIISICYLLLLFIINFVLTVFILFINNLILIYLFNIINIIYI
jgi:hypothetical protein